MAISIPKERRYVAICTGGLARHSPGEFDEPKYMGVLDL